MDKPSVYIETSIVSYLAADPSRHPVTLRNQQLTHAWWNTRRERYELHTSDFVEQEAALGNPRIAQRRLALIAELALLASPDTVNELAKLLQSGVPLPARAKMDAFHIAAATVHRMTHLLTWDSRHIANPRLHPRIQRICLQQGYATPRLCTPYEMMGE